jgi:hypothetical protein
MLNVFALNKNIKYSDSTLKAIEYLLDIEEKEGKAYDDTKSEADKLLTRLVIIDYLDSHGFIGNLDKILDGHIILVCSDKYEKNYSFTFCWSLTYNSSHCYLLRIKELVKSKY